MAHLNPIPPTLSREALERLRRGVVAVRSHSGLMELAGPGAVACLQGLLTNDVERPGTGSLVYGALLTPKGAIVADLWAARLDDRFVLLTEPEAREPAAAIFQRVLPPRLARLEDRTGDSATLWLYGPQALDRMRQAGLPAPERPGRVLRSGTLIVGRPAAGAPFEAVLAGPAAELDEAALRLGEAGIPFGDEADREAARIIAGWPRLGREIDDRTLVQEVRYDEIGGVSYAKGCFTGQETVARLHFRGHTNRTLRGLRWREPPVTDPDAVALGDGRVVGTVGSRVNLPDRALGLALIRREVPEDATVVAGGREARLVPLPHDPGAPLE